jgi:hypothetical protein
MATIPINVRITGSGTRPESVSNKDGNKAIQLMSNSSSASKPIEPEVVINVKKPDISKLTSEALKATATLVESIGGESASDTVNVMRKSAKVAETIPTAVAGIKREAKPAVNAISELWSALEDQGIVGVRDRVDISEMRKKK